MIIYAIGDVHGRLELLNNLLSQIENDDAQGHDKEVVFLGDYVDRGTDSDRVLDFLMGLDDILGTDSVKHIFIKGNHEDMMVNVYHRDGHVDMWVTTGGRLTLDAFECVSIVDRSESYKCGEWEYGSERHPT